MNETSDLATTFAPLWQRKWLILLVAILVAVATYVYYHGQAQTYSASTQLDLGSGTEAQQLISGSPNRTAPTSRSLADAAALITSTYVTEAVRERLREEGVQPSDLGKVRAKAASESYFITITAEAHGAEAAARLANDYAQTYAEKQHLGYRREIQAAILSTRKQLRRIEIAQGLASAVRPASTARGPGLSRTSGAVEGSAAVIQAADLASKINQLESELSISSVQQVNPASSDDAQLVSPTPSKNAIFGFVLGLLLAGLAVFVLSRFDLRIRSLGQIEAIFKAQILTVLPRESAPIDYRDGHPRPAESLLEPLRRLHTALQLGDMLDPAREAAPRLILFLDADTGDGRSTVVADLALTQRDAGARVAVIEADLRRPAQAGLLSVSDSPGLAEVLEGTVTVEEALQSVGSTPRVSDVNLTHDGAGLSTVVQSRGTGSLLVLAGGKPVANPPALIASHDMRELLRTAAADYDYVLIDAPPPLQVSDAMPLLHWVDGIVIVVQMGRTPEVSAEHLARLLADSSTAPVLGIVADAVPRAEIKRSGYSSTYGERRWPSVR